MVQLRLSIADSGEVRDVLVRAAAGTTWAQLCRAEPALPETVFAGARAVSPHSVVGDPPLVHAALLSSVPTVPDARSLLELVVVEGADCGVTVPLGATEVSVGRGGATTLRLTDPAASREHARVRLTAGLVTVVDHGSTNGSRIDGRPVPAFAETALRVGAHLEIGSTRIQLSRSGSAGRAADAGEPVPVEISLPRRPVPAERRSWPLLLAVAPLLVSGAAALLLRNPIFLVFALLSPVMVLGQYLSERRGGSRSHREAMRGYRLERARAEQDAARALADELALRCARSPALGQVIRLATHDPTAHGSRDPDLGLRVRLGSAPVASLVRLREPSAALGTGTQRLDRAPVEIDLRAQPAVVLTGPHRRRLAHSLLIQLATWYAPTQLRIRVLCGPENLAQWQWVRALPHVLLDPGGTPDLSTDPRYLPPLTGMVTVLVLDEPFEQLPPDTIGIVLRERFQDQERQLCVRTSPDGTAAILGVAGVLGRLALDLPAPGVADRCARALARTAAGGEQTGLPATVPVTELFARELGTEATDPDDVRRLWQQDGDRIPLGRTADGVCWLDLPADGPHALVAGTTGSGKSALLQTLLVSWALRQPPDRLSYVLIDYKGGSAFAGCASLPHTVGLVTDLDPPKTARALRSLQAEVRRRERLLADAGAADLTDYRRRAPDAALTRLVIVIDEFRVLAEELPQFVAGLVRIAAVGRSLGIHLVLATQRPAGIVSADIRANVDVRIALRTTDCGDSQDVVGSDAAAQLDPGTPGRAVVRIAGDGGTTVQVARLVAGGPRTPQVWPIDPVSGSPVIPDRPEDHLARVVDTIRTAAHRLGAPPAHRPWLPPLPERVIAEPAAAGVVDLGVVDHPDQQRQDRATWCPGDGNLAILGGPASGRTTVLLTIATGDGCPTYVIGSTKPFALQALPHVGAIVAFDETARLHRMLRWLESQIDRPREHPIRILVDDWDSLHERADPDSLAVADALLRIMRDGPRSGIVVVVAGGRALLGARVAPLARRRICLTAAGSEDLLPPGVPTDRGSTARVPGRGILLPEQCEIQCALPGAPPVAGAAVRFDPLPASVELRDLPATAVGCGLDGPVDLLPQDRSILVAGPAGSGRTTAVAAIASQLRRQELAVGWVATGTCPVPGVDRLDPGDPAGVYGWVRRHPSGALCIDDLDRSAGTPLEQQLSTLGTTRLIASAATETVVSAFTGPLAVLRRSGTGLLLQPTRRDGAVFAVTLPAPYDEGPGSGVLVRRGRITPLRIGVYQPPPPDLL